MTISQVSRKILIALAISASLGAAGMAFGASDSTDSSASVGAAMSDTAITGQVKTKFATDNRLKGSDVSVTTNNGVVTLTGSAPTAAARHAAESLASNISGVRSVNNQIEAPSAASDLGAKTRHATHGTAAAIEDTAITADLKTKFAADSKIKGSDISVKTDHGVVALSGTVESAAQKTHVVKVARHTKGVQQVDTTALTIAR